jgi:hypothetical protein
MNGRLETNRRDRNQRRFNFDRPLRSEPCDASQPLLLRKPLWLNHSLHAIEFCDPMALQEQDLDSVKKFEFTLLKSFVSRFIRLLLQLDVGSSRS